MPLNGDIAAARRGDEIKRLLERRVLMLDGAMGTMIQSYNLDEAGYRGERFQRRPAFQPHHARPLLKSKNAVVLPHPDRVS